MEYRYIDIQAHIRQAQKLRSDALGEILATGWKSGVRLIKSFAHLPLHKNGHAARSTASASS